jgi:hypothetical protein
MSQFEHGNFAAFDIESVRVPRRAKLSANTIRLATLPVVKAQRDRPKASMLEE